MIVYYAARCAYRKPLYETGILDSRETIRRLKTEALANQIVFHTEEALRLCRFIECREIGV